MSSGLRAQPRRVEVLLPVDLDLDEAALCGDPAGWLPPPARPQGLGVHRTRLHVGPLHHDVDLHVGAPWQDGSATWRALTWVPTGGPTDPVAPAHGLPTFAGELGLLRRPTPDRPAGLVLSGTYEAPGGIVGATLDRVGLHRVARATLLALLEHIRGALRT